MSRRARAQASVLLGIVVMTLAQGCRGGPAPWEAAARPALQTARTAGTSVDDLLREGGRGLDDVSRSLDNAVQKMDAAVESAPRNLNPEEQALLNRLHQSSEAAEVLQRAVDIAEETATALPQEASAVVNRHIPPADYPSEAAILNDITDTLVTDVFCDITINMLLPGEREIQQGRSVPDVVQPTIESVAQKAFQVLAGRFGSGWGRAVDWAQYGGEVVEVAEKWARAGPEVATGPGWQRSQAVYQYGRVCLRPPN